MLERTLAWAEAARRGAQEFQRKEVAPLKIGLAPSISVSLVLDPIAEIAKFVPGLHVELRQGSAENLTELLLEGEINTAMVWDVRDIPAPSTTGCCSRSATSRFSRRHTRSQTVPRFGIDDLRETVLLNAPDSTSPRRSNGRISPRNHPSSGTAAVTTCTCSTWPRQAPA
jgi:DNA-binding transcriptional LysR family regulator